MPHLHRARPSPAAAPLVIALVAVLAASPARPVAADVVTDWNAQTFAVGGPQLPRTLAMVHLAMFDAVNAVQPRYTAYLPLPTPPAGTSAVAAAASAAHGVLVRLFPASTPALDAALDASLAAVPDDQGRADGVAFGDQVALAIYAARLTDNMLSQGPIYTSTLEPGDYRLTTPAPPQPVNTGAAAWLPFALQSASQFRPNGPASLTGPQYARDLDETRRLGGAVSAERTAEQSLIARWHTEQAHFQFNRIARSETPGDGRDLLDHARLFALLNLALVDSGTAVFEAKYYYRAWRPVTAINLADLDGNPRTSPDPTWTSYQVTPPHPEYPAAHGAVQGAAGRIMKAYFGPRYGFSTTAPTVPGVTRSFESFDAYTEDGALARILGGMHFRSSLDEGSRQGVLVGNWVLDHYLLPLR